ncbi:hypothetical protein HDV04_005291 [Boothiomyces sp. JEL0838]|nr:hypothetical protein HDV04_005291 [Boothiomyces sp. JEL0838]
MQGMFRKQNINIPLHKGSFLAPSKLGDVLMKAYQMSHVGFDFVFVDKPVDGTLFLFASQGQAEIPEDGFVLLISKEQEMEVFSRNQGFSIGDTHAVVKRKRYRLVQYADIQLLHYIRSPMDQTSIPVQLALIKVKPRPTPSQGMQGSPQHRMPGQMPGMQGVPGIPGGMANRLTQEQQLQFKKAQQQKLRQSAQVKMVEDEREPSGDELDKGYGRLMALERYKRNHLYIEQVFSPYNVCKRLLMIANLVPPKLFADVSESRMAAIKQHQADLDAELKELQDKYHADIEDFKKKSAAEWKLIHELSLRKK